MKYKLEDLLTIKYGKNQKKVVDENGTIPILGTGGIMGWAKEYLYDKPSVLIPRKGSISKVRYIDKPFWTVDTLFYSIINEELVLPKYLYYNLSRIDFTHYNEGTTIPSLRTQTLKNIEIEIHSLGDQKRIVTMLDGIEDKIELNNQINQTLEEMAQAIFKHWFVDFEFPNENGEPYKSSGGKFVESELGMIPGAWNVKSLGDLINIVDNRGKTPPLSDGKTPFPIIDVRALSGNSRIVDYNNCTKFVEKDTFENWFRSGHPKEEDILLSTVGTVGEMKLFMGEVGCIAQNVVALRSKSISSCYLYQYLNFIKNDLISYNIGSVQPSIKITHIIKHNILTPTQEVLTKFENVIKPITYKIYNNSKENKELNILRDTLLPKLMSGEIRIPDAEQEVEACL